LRSHLFRRLPPERISSTQRPSWLTVPPRSLCAPHPVPRLHITAEGQTEQSFARNVLAPHLARFYVFADARCDILTCLRISIF
jgi:hypothetical protein